MDRSRPALERQSWNTSCQILATPDKFRFRFGKGGPLPVHCWQNWAGVGPTLMLTKPGRCRSNFGKLGLVRPNVGNTGPISAQCYKTGPIGVRVSPNGAGCTPSLATPDRHRSMFGNSGPSPAHILLIWTKFGFGPMLARPRAPPPLPPPPHHPESGRFGTPELPEK